MRMALPEPGSIRLALASACWRSIAWMSTTAVLLFLTVATAVEVFLVAMTALLVVNGRKKLSCAVVETLLGEGLSTRYLLAALEQLTPRGVADPTLQQMTELVLVDVRIERIPVSDLRHCGGADGDRAMFGGCLLDASGFESFEHLCIEKSDLPFNILDGSLELRLLLAKREDFVDG